jgi:hypothetical protein
VRQCAEVANLHRGTAETRARADSIDARKPLTKVRDVSDRATVETVRGFNRIVTQRVGALQDSYLARDRPLAESRVLWEIGERDCEVRTLRSRLDLARDT